MQSVNCAFLEALRSDELWGRGVRREALVVIEYLKSESRMLRE